MLGQLGSTCCVCGHHNKIPLRSLHCNGCGRFVHQECCERVSVVLSEKEFLLNSVVDVHTVEKLGHIKANGKKLFCRACGKETIKQRLLKLQEEGRIFHPEGPTALSAPMKMTVLGVEKLFSFLGLREGNETEDYRRDRERAIFGLYKKAAILSSSPNVKLVPIERKPGEQEISLILPKQLVGSRADGIVTVVIAFHGGAFVMGSHDTPAVEKILKRITAETGAVCVSANYRKAPEHFFPDWNDDARSALDWVWNHLHEHIPACRGFKVVVMGDSAGGNIAAALAQDCRDRVFSGLYIYPILNLASFNTKSWHENGADDKHLLLRRGLAMSLLPKLFRNKDDCLSPLASPLFDKNFESLPLNHILAGAFDPLLDDAAMYHRKCLDAGVCSTLSIYDSCPHGWVAFPYPSPEIDEVSFEIVSVISHWTDLPCPVEKQRLCDERK